MRTVHSYFSDQQFFQNSIHLESQKCLCMEVFSKLICLQSLFIPCNVNICLLYCLSSRGKDALSGPAKSILEHKVIEHTIFWWPFDRQVIKPRHQPHLSNHQDCKATKWWGWDLNPVLSLPAQVLPVIHLCALEETESRLYQLAMYYTGSKCKRTGFTFCLDQWAFLFTNFQDLKKKAYTFLAQLCNLCLNAHKVTLFIPLYVSISVCK